MNITLFYHSLKSDWNHGNAHFLRGIVWELQNRGHNVTVYEPRNAWSLQNLRQHAPDALKAFRRAYPTLASRTYTPATANLNKLLANADLVIVHEWSDPDLVARIGQHRRRSGRYTLLLHDTHHRAVTAPHEMARYDLSHYHAVLAFGNVLRDLYLKRRWTARAFTWHEAADTRIFRPLANQPTEGDLVWVGNWGDNERTAELHEFLLNPVRQLALKARIHGVRYPADALKALRRANITYGDYLPNFAAPQTFARYKVTVHVPRRPYVAALPGIPTIRVFEALACGIPLVCAPWHDAENLFTPGQDYLLAPDSAAMTAHLRKLVNEPQYARQLAAHGHRTILSRHTCAHRVDELLNIVAELQSESRQPAAAAPPPPTRRRKPALSA